MVTTEAEKRRVLEAVQAGVNDYLVKPFTPEQLAAKTQEFAAAMVTAPVAPTAATATRTTAPST